MTSEPARPPGGRYTPIRHLGQGGQGSVWLYRDERLEREVALKHLALDGWLEESSAAEARERARREARTMARVTHPVLVQIHDVIDSEPGALWLVMKYIEGPSLRTLVNERGVLGDQAVARIGLEVLRGLEAVHHMGIVHRDVKPANIVVADGPAGEFQVVLVDFGIAMAIDGTRLTKVNFVVGTPGYIAPERYDGDPGSPASDLWSLGATLYFAIHREPPPPPGGGTGSPGRGRSALDSVIDRLLARDPGLRLKAPEAREELKRIAAGPQAPPPRPPPPTSPSPPPRPRRREPSAPQRPPRRAGKLPAEAWSARASDRAAAELAKLPPPEAASRLASAAGTDLPAAIAIMERLNTGTAARILGYLKSQPSALLLGGIHPLDAAMILCRVDDRTAAHGTKRMPVADQVSILKKLDLLNTDTGQTRPTSAPAVLGAHAPAHAAALVRADPWVEVTVLPKVAETVREYIRRELRKDPPPGR